MKASTPSRESSEIGRDADRLLQALSLAGSIPHPTSSPNDSRKLKIGGRATRLSRAAIDALLSAGLAERRKDDSGRDSLSITAAGRSRAARQAAAPDVAFLAQHASLRETEIDGENGRARMLVNDGESPLAWLHRRKGPDGAPLISAMQFAAGERLRADLDRSRMMPRVTANWSSSVSSGRRGVDPGLASDAMVAARQRVDRALRAAGPEFSGVLVDVCGFLKRLPDIERERGWPARSAKIVLELALTRLARHYGLAETACGPDRSTGIRFWGAEDFRPSLDGAA